VPSGGVRLEHELPLTIDQVRPEPLVAGSDQDLRDDVHAGDVERDRAKTRLERVVGISVRMPDDPAQLDGTGPASAGGDAAKRGRGDAVPECGVGDRERLVEREESKTLVERDLDVRGDAVADLVGEQVAEVGDQVITRRTVSLARNDDVGSPGDLVDLHP
jgi:hypothetical protein